MHSVQKIILILAAFLIASSGIAAKQIGKLSLVIGKVDVRTSGGSWNRATSGMSISDNTEIQTSLKGKAVVQMTTGSSVSINPGSLMSFDKFATGSYGTATDVSLKMGRITAVVARHPDARNHFRVKTPTAVAGVRGTTEEIGYSPDLGTEVILHESSADIIGANGQRSFVPQGGSASATEQQMLPPGEMANREESVVLGNNSMSSDEMDFFFDSSDTLFSGNANDFNEFWGFFDELDEDQFYDDLFNNFERVEFERL